MNGLPFALNTEKIMGLASNDTTFRKGLAYARNGNIKSLTRNDHAIWKAQVRGSELYHVYIQFQEKEISAECECPAYYSYDGYCKHIVAVLCKILDQIEQGEEIEIKRSSSPLHDTYSAPRLSMHTSKIYQLFDKFKERKPGSLDTIPNEKLSIEYILHINTKDPQSLINVEMRVGNKRLYVVRKIREFLESVVKNESYFFTSNFIFDPYEQHIAEHDMEVIQLLSNISLNEKFYKEVNRYYMSNRLDERSLSIPPLFADSLMKLLSQCQCIINGIENEKTLDWKEELPPISFELNEWGKEGFLLKMNGLKNGVFLEEYQYVLLDHVLYKLPENAFELLFEMKNTLPQQEWSFEKQEIERVISSVIPDLKKLGKVSVVESISNQIFDPSLTAKLKVDFVDYRLIVKLSFHYDDIIIDPLLNSFISRGNDSTILLREVDKEQKIMDMIEQTPLKWNGQEMYIEDEEDIYTFLFDSIPQLEKEMRIYVTTAAKSIMFEEIDPPKTNLEINNMTNLLEISFDMDGLNNEEILQILRAVVEKKKYYRLSDGRYISLEDEKYGALYDLFEELEIKKSQITGTVIKAPTVKGLQIEEIIKQGSMKIGKSLRNLLSNLKHPEDLDFEIPDQLEPILRDYQKTGYQWLKTLSYYHFGGILADDMGLGKTLQAITFILSERTKLEQNPGEQPVMIISPASLIYNWKKEFEKFAPELKVAVISGDASERVTLLSEMNQYDVLITSYPMLRRDIDLYENKLFQILILDEAQAIKNDKTQQAHAVRRIQASKKFALSGTPIENSLDELWSIFQVVLPGLFSSKQQFREMSPDKISRIVSPFILRRMKRDVLTELPEKIETVQISDLSKEQKKLYVGYLERIKQEAQESLLTGNFNKNRMKILAGLTRLRQICCHPSLFLENYDDGSGKMEQLFDILETSLANDRRILIFSQFTSMLNIIRKELDEKGISYFYLDGQTDKLARVEMTERFNDGENNVFLISLKAGGTGLNLTGADTVILYDLWWNPAVDEQAVDRAHRMGQKNKVQVIRLITQGTIEEKIYQLQQKKKELIDKIIQPGETMISSLTEEELKELLDI